MICALGSGSDSQHMLTETTILHLGQVTDMEASDAMPEAAQVA